MTLETYKSVINRILAKILENKKTTCWLWLGLCNNVGYGQIRGPKSKTVVLVHRYIYWHYKVRKQKGVPWDIWNTKNFNMCVCHTCDIRNCCNPKHLKLKTQYFNIQDCKIKGRLNKVHGEKHNFAKLTEKQVLKIYKMKGLHKNIAEVFDVSPTTVYHIKKGIHWNWLTLKPKNLDDK